MADNSPIGVFDSGLGGLSVWKEIVKALPEESVIYYGDGLNCPYGKKKPEEVIAISEGIVRFLLDKEVKLIVIACNTATATAVEYLRQHYPHVPFIGMEPAIKPAAEHSRTGVIGILATVNTLRGRLFRETSRRFAENVKVIPAVGEGFVRLVEENREDSPEALEAVRKAVEPLLEAGADHLVLGCTHYPFLAETIRKVIGERDVRLVDPAPAIAHRVVEILREKGACAIPGHRAEYAYYTSGDEKYLSRLKEKGEQVRRSGKKA